MFLSQDSAPASKQVEDKQSASASSCATPEVKGEVMTMIILIIY